MGILYSDPHLFKVVCHFVLSNKKLARCCFLQYSAKKYTNNMEKVCRFQNFTDRQRDRQTDGKSDGGSWSLLASYNK